MNEPGLMAPGVEVPASDFWQRVGRGIARAAQATGRGIAQAFGSLDPDVRRQLAEAPLMALTLLPPSRSEPEPQRADGHRPLICIHGLGGRRGNFLPMRLWLRHGGRSRTYAPSLPAAGSLEDKGVFLGEFIARVLEINDLPPGSQVDLVAHSMGGVVARCALQDPVTAARVANLITLGSPHGGTFAARYASTRHTLELRPDSPLVERLARQIPWTGPPRLVCFWSRADIVMLPATTARVDGAEDVELVGISHYGYLLYPRVWRRVRQALGD